MDTNINNSNNDSNNNINISGNDNKPYFSFQWHITDNCDQRCKHCYIYSCDNSELELHSMTLDEMKLIIQRCIDLCEVFNCRPYFFITGGDPILNKDFWNLLHIFKEKDIPFSIMGNPFHLNNEVCTQLYEYGCRDYQFSIDGVEKTHDWFRKKGSFQETLNKIECLHQANIKCGIMTTVSSINIDEIPEIIDTVVKYKADFYAFARYCPTDKDKSVGITPQRYRQLLADCDTIFKKYSDDRRANNRNGVITNFSAKDHLWTLYQYETGEFKLPETDTQDNYMCGGCNCTNYRLTIVPNGDVYACRRVQNSIIGNAFKEPLIDIWNKHANDYRHFTEFKKCSKCKLLKWCRGCPAVASATTGDFYAEDPQCWMEITE